MKRIKVIISDFIAAHLSKGEKSSVPQPEAIVTPSRQVGTRIDVNITTRITLELTAGEAGALQAICGYGPDIFLKWFQQTHGKYYIEPYKGHLRSLFNKARMLQYQVEKVEEKLKEIPKVIIV